MLYFENLRQHFLSYMYNLCWESTVSWLSCSFSLQRTFFFRKRGRLGTIRCEEEAEIFSWVSWRILYKWYRRYQKKFCETPTILCLLKEGTSLGLISVSRNFIGTFAVMRTMSVDTFEKIHALLCIIYLPIKFCETQTIICFLKQARVLHLISKLYWYSCYHIDT